MLSDFAPHRPTQARRCIGVRPRAAALVALLCLAAPAVMANEASQPPAAPVFQGLNGALQATVRFHPSIRASSARLEGRRADLGTARAQRLPSINAQADNLDDRERGIVTVKQPLWSFGRIHTSIKQAKKDWNAEQWELLATQRELMVATAEAYARIQGIREQLDIARDNINRHQALYERIDRRAKGRLASKSDVDLAHSRLMQAQARAEQVRGQMRTALTELRSLTRYPVDASVPVENELPELPDEQRLRALVLEENPEVRSLQLQAESASLDIKRQKAAALPTVYFQVERDVGDVPDTLSDETRAGLSIEASLGGAGFSSYSKVKSAAAALSSARHEVDAQRVRLENQVLTTLSGLRTQQALRASRERTLELMRQTMDSFVRQYETGRKSWVEVLNTRRELTEARFLLAQARNESLILQLRLAALAGLLDDNAGIENDAS